MTHTARPTVQPGAFLTLHYRLRAADGAEVLSTFGGTPATVSLGGGQLAPAMESCLLGLEEGSQAQFALAPGQAYGERQPAMVQKVALALLRQLGDPDEAYAPGDVVQFPTPDGRGRYAGVVREVQADHLLIDFNHPLAGQALTFDVHLIGVL